MDEISGLCCGGSGEELPHSCSGDGYMEYKILPLNVEVGASAATVRAVSRLVEKDFGPGLRLDTDAVPVSVLLHEVDLKRLVERVDDLRGEKRRFLRVVVDNIENVRSYGLRSGRRVYVDYAGERKVRGRKAKETARRPLFYARSFPKENTALPDGFVNATRCGDSEEILRELPDNCIDLVFTSPPYNFGLEYKNEASDSDLWGQYFEKLNRIWDECIRVVKHGGRIAVNVQPLYSDYVPSHHLISRHFLDRGLIWKGEILWEKNNYNCKYTAWGSWKSPSSPYLKYTWEFVEVFCKGVLKKDGSPENADISGDDFKKWVCMPKWSIAPERKMRITGIRPCFQRIGPAGDPDVQFSGRYCSGSVYGSWNHLRGGATAGPLLSRH